jgi:hypothetical protein
MSRRLFTTYAMLSRGDSGTPPPPPPQGDEEEDSDDEGLYDGLPTDVEVEEAAAEKRVIIASFEMWRHDDSAQ